MFTVYVLHSTKYDRLYIGQTKDIDRRLIEHNSGLSKSTKHYLPWKLIHTEVFNTRAEAMKREKELKTHAGRNSIRERYLQN